MILNKDNRVVHTCHTCVCTGKIGKYYPLASNSSSTVLRAKFSLFDEIAFTASDNWPKTNSATLFS